MFRFASGISAIQPAQSPATAPKPPLVPDTDARHAVYDNIPTLISDISFAKRAKPIIEIKKCSVRLERLKPAPPTDVPKKKSFSRSKSTKGNPVTASRVKTPAKCSPIADKSSQFTETGNESGQTPKHQQPPSEPYSENNKKMFGDPGLIAQLLSLVKSPQRRETGSALSGRRSQAVRSASQVDRPASQAERSASQAERSASQADRPASQAVRLGSQAEGPATRSRAVGQFRTPTPDVAVSRVESPVFIPTRIHIDEVSPQFSFFIIYSVSIHRIFNSI